MKVLSRLLASLGTIWLLLTFTPAVPAWALWLSTGTGFSSAPAPVLVVLAGDMPGDGSIGYSTYLRCLYAFWTWREGGVQELVLSGGPQQRPAAAAMADFLAGLGVPRDQMRLETGSLDTRQNLAGVAAMLVAEPRPVTLLTSDFHMRRSLRLARRVRLKVTPRPIPDVLKRASAERWSRSTLAVLLAIETSKLAAEALRDAVSQP